MGNPQSKPSRSLKTRKASTLTTGASHIYPPSLIPPRHVSLNVVSRACSTQSASSARTPSIESHDNQIQIVKIRDKEKSTGSSGQLHEGGHTDNASDNTVVQNVPVTTVSLKAVADTPRITTRATSLSISVDAHVDVNPVETFDFGYSRPLDMIIVFDHM